MADARVFERARGRTQSTRTTILLSFGLVANLAALMTFAATLNEIAAEWSLDASQSGWIGGIYFAGYAISVPFLASATDRMDARWLYVGSALLGSQPRVRAVRGRLCRGDDLAVSRWHRSRRRPYAGPEPPDGSDRPFPSGTRRGHLYVELCGGQCGVIPDRRSRRCRVRLAGDLHRRRDRAFAVDLCSGRASRSSDAPDLCR